MGINVYSNSLTTISVLFCVSNVPNESVQEVAARAGETGGGEGPGEPVPPDRINVNSGGGPEKFKNDFDL